MKFFLIQKKGVPRCKRNLWSTKEGLEHCIAIFDHDQGEFKNYEIKAEMLSLESSEGSNSGNIGLVFNYMDDEPTMTLCT